MFIFQSSIFLLLSSGGVNAIQSAVVLSLKVMVNSFAIHLKRVYELDSFYGDETLRGLLEHAISFNEQMDTFEYIISLTEEGVAPIEELPDDNTEEEKENQT